MRLVNLDIPTVVATTRSILSFRIRTDFVLTLILRVAFAQTLLTVFNVVVIQSFELVFPTIFQKELSPLVLIFPVSRLHIDDPFRIFDFWTYHIGNVEDNLPAVFVLEGHEVLFGLQFFRLFSV